jgi:hypothetical protein
MPVAERVDYPIHALDSDLLMLIKTRSVEYLSYLAGDTTPRSIIVGKRFVMLDESDSIFTSHAIRSRASDLCHFDLHRGRGDGLVGRHHRRCSGLRAQAGEIARARSVIRRDAMVVSQPCGCLE